MKAARKTRGMASFAIFLFALVSVLILVANFKLNFAVSSTSDAYDSFSSQLVEKNGIAQLVKESVLAVGETAISTSSGTLQSEIQARLSSIQFPSDVTIALDPGTPVPAVPANPFFPSAAPAAASQPAYFTPAGGVRALAGMGNLLSSLCILGPVADLGRLTVVFDRSTSSSASDNRTYTVNADLFSVPLTNVDVVAYGLPVTGSVPGAAPAVPQGFFAPDVSCLTVTSNNPSSDPTAFGDLFASSGTEQLPYQYRNAVSFCWNAYEYLWSPAYQNALLGAALLNGSVYNFSSPPDQDVPGVTVSGTSATVDCSAVVGSVIAIVDPDGIGSVTVVGSPSPGAPFVLLVRNTAGQRTPVTFSGDNARPAIFYLENSGVTFAGSPQIQGALFLDPNTTASGSVTWFGHFSFYGPANPLGTLGITVADSPAVKSSLAPIAPRVLLVSASATR